MDSLTNELAKSVERMLTLERYPQVFSDGERYTIQREAWTAYHKYVKAVDEEVEKAKSTPIGICPACKQTVFQSDDAVWTCPRDLSENNPYWQPSDVTEEMMERDGVFSKCWEDHGGYCSDHMPLHGSCYEKGNY